MVLDADVTFWKERSRKVKSRDARAAGGGEKCNFHPIGGSVEPAYGGSGPGNAIKRVLPSNPTTVMAGRNVRFKDCVKKFKRSKDGAQ